MRRFLYIIIVCIAVCLCAGCAQQQARETVFAMDTVMDLQVWGKDGETALQQSKALLRQLEDRWSATAGNSALGKMNRGEDAGLIEEEQTLLSRVEELALRTDGAFNPKLYRVSLLWGFYNDASYIPAEAELTEALADPAWDLGAAMKGYAGMQCVRLLEQLEVERALLNLGGNIQTYGEKPDGTPWNIGIQNPDGGDYIGVVAISGTASIVTSGDYQRYFEKDGVRYHHIIDPQTGMPARSGLRSVTVICRDGLTADALSTALFVMGLEKSAEFWRGSDDFEAVFITEEGTVYATEGVRFSGCDYEVIAREN